MTNPQKAKGDKAEREVSALIAALTGWDVKRKLGAGRREDTGDLYGIPQTTAQVKDYTDVLRSIREGLDVCRAQQANSGDTFGVTFIRRRGGRWLAVMDLEQWATYARESSTVEKVA